MGALGRMLLLLVPRSMQKSLYNNSRHAMPHLRKPHECTSVLLVMTAPYRHRHLCSVLLSLSVLFRGLGLSYSAAISRVFEEGFHLHHILDSVSATLGRSVLRLGLVVVFYESKRR